MTLWTWKNVYWKSSGRALFLNMPADHGSNEVGRGGGEYPPISNRCWMHYNSRTATFIFSQYTDLPYGGYRAPFQGVKRPGHGVVHSPPSSVEVKERSELFLLLPLWQFTARPRASFTLTIGTPLQTGWPLRQGLSPTRGKIILFIAAWRHYLMCIRFLIKVKQKLFPRV